MTEIRKEGWNSANPESWDMDLPKNAGTHPLHGKGFRTNEAAGNALTGAGAKKTKVHDFEGYEHPQHGLFGVSSGKIKHYGNVTKSSDTHEEILRKMWEEIKGLNSKR